MSVTSARAAITVFMTSLPACPTIVGDPLQRTRADSSWFAVTDEIGLVPESDELYLCIDRIRQGSRASYFGRLGQSPEIALLISCLQSPSESMRLNSEETGLDRGPCKCLRWTALE